MWHLNTEMTVLTYRLVYLRRNLISKLLFLELALRRALYLRSRSYCSIKITTMHRNNLFFVFFMAFPILDEKIPIECRKKPLKTKTCVLKCKIR